MDFLFDPSLWVGLLTLIVLEIVLGVDNLVFIAILAKKLPVAQQDRALYTGLGLALFMRIGLLSIMSWLVGLTAPLFTLFEHAFSARDLILMAGGIFLVFKATMELHERLEAKPHEEAAAGGSSSFWAVIAQILVLDAVFSIDSIITAVGMVDNLGVMVAAVIVAIIVMMAASRPLTNFVNRHPTVVILCLSFLLMIGCSLIADGLGFHIPKGYLYAAIGFSILIEAFNQIGRRNADRRDARLPFRARTTQAIVTLMERRPGGEAQTAAEAMAPAKPAAFTTEERLMVEGVLSLADRSIRMIMTPRSDIGWLNLKKPVDEILEDAQRLNHSLFPVGDGSLDRLVGFVKAKELIDMPRDVQMIRQLAQARQGFMVPETISVIRLMRDVKKSRAQVAVVTDEFGVVQGLVTSHDILEAIAGDFPDEGDRNLLLETPEGWLADGTADLVVVSQALGVDLSGESESYVTVAGLLLERFGRLPQAGESVDVAGWRFVVKALERNRIATVLMTRAPEPEAASAAEEAESAAAEEAPRSSGR